MLCSRHSRVARNGAVLAQYASGFLACLLTCFIVASVTVLLADVCTDYDIGCAILCALDACFLYVSITITCLIADTIQLVMGPAARLACKTAQMLRHGLRVLSRRIANASVHAIGNILLDILELAMFKPFVCVAQLFRYAWCSAQYFCSVMYCCKRFGVCATARAYLISLLRR